MLEKTHRFEFETTTGRAGPFGPSADQARSARLSSERVACIFIRQLFLVLLYACSVRAACVQ